MTIGAIETLFKQFIAAHDLRPTLELFSDLCGRLNVSPSEDHAAVYRVFRDRFQKESSALWKSLDKRRANAEYGGGEVCKGVKALIVGAGPCGLRLAIECAMLGVKTVVIEAREYFSRNNVLHLWPFVIQDIKMLGGKAIYPKFCTGALDHVSIKRMQLMLLKMALLLGVEVHTPVRYEGMLQPQAGSGNGWRAKLTPANSPAARLDYDVVVGANGKTGGAAFPDFSRKVMRGKLAIAITANFVNKNSSAELQVREIGGLFYIFDQEFFNNLKLKCGVELENFVYYKDDTHYFVMTVKKNSLLQKGVLKQDYPNDPATLLSPPNRNMDKLHAFAKEVAMATTQNQLPNYDFEVNHHGEEDVAMFDFTSMSMANHSCYVKKRGGKTLLQCIVGDSLLEPFWPTGSGCARGFLGVLDTAWMIRSWFLREVPEVQLVAEREGTFQILSQTKPDNLAKAHTKYTIDPLSRYGTRLRTKTMVGLNKIKHLIDTGDGTGPSPLITQPSPVVKPAKTPSKPVKDKPMDNQPKSSTPVIASTKKPEKSIFDQISEDNRRKKRLRGGSLDTRVLLSWFQTQLQPFSRLFTIKDLNESWRDGLGLCALVELYRPHVCQLATFRDSDRKSRVQIGLTLIEQEFGVEPMLSADDVCRDGPVDKLAMLSYLAQVNEVLENEPPKKMPRLQSGSKPSLERTSAVPESTPPRIAPPAPRPDATSPSAKAMLKHLTSSMALKSMEQAAERTEAWLSDPHHPHPTAANTDVMEAVLKSTRTPNKSKLSRKKVMFKKPPPAVVKYRQSQVDIGENKDIIGRESEEPGQGFQRKVRPSVKLCRGIAANRLKAFEQGGVGVKGNTEQEIEPRNDDLGPWDKHAAITEEPEEAEENLSQYSDNNDDRALGQVPGWMVTSESRAACQGLAQQRIQALRGADSVQQVPERDKIRIPASVLAQNRSRGNIPQARLTPSPESHKDTRGRQLPDVPRGRSLEKLQQQHKRSSSPVTSDLCCVCRKPLLLVQRYTAHGVFFHKACFRCATCNTALHVGTSVMQKKHGQVHFYCYSHAYTAGAIDVSFASADVSKSSDSTDSSPREQTQSASKPTVRGQTDSAGEESSSEESMSSDDDDEEEDDMTEEEYLALHAGEDADVLSQLSTSTLPKNPTKSTLKKALRSQNSLRLLVADEIQRGLDDVQSQEQQLTEKGQLVENRLRTKPETNIEPEKIVETQTDDKELMDEWLDVLRKKKELVDREAKLMLKAKLVELQERHNRLQLTLNMVGMNDADVQCMVEQLAQDTEYLEDEMECLVDQMKSLSTYLAKEDASVA